MTQTFIAAPAPSHPAQTPGVRTFPAAALSATAMTIP
eukprot:CAMPEP_0172704534 /NCGR_PEP_ID=MMETSP1074-20121228/41789_1 /TAXON_ID=2916 /ORGANISM="Ceratium fusus, Strain PA161109" /LENGTH=36 /DNA_ID= /DNA_START= /DNA_END= /DNA_ORIENTATION=